MNNTNKQSIKEIKEIFEKINVDEIEEITKKYEFDTRAGVKKIIDTALKKKQAYLKEIDRIYNLKKYERQYGDYEFIGGIDEVGRGPFAGPVVTACVILPKDCDLLYINDSKKLSAKMRNELFDKIKEKAISIGIGMESPYTIDEINILQATYKAMQSAIENMSVTPDILLVDAVTIPKIKIKQVPIIKGDAKSISIGAASIIAKVTRDRMMEEYDKIYPGYGFASNKGYGSSEHIKALKTLGPTPIHRKSFIHSFV